MSQKLIEEYAVNLVVNAIQSSTEDDLDEDAVFSCAPEGCDHIGLCPEHEAALNLADNIALWIRHHADDMVLMVQTELPEIG